MSRKKTTVSDRLPWPLPAQLSLEAIRRVIEADPIGLPDCDLRAIRSRMRREEIRLRRRVDAEWQRIFWRVTSEVGKQRLAKAVARLKRAQSAREVQS